MYYAKANIFVNNIHSTITYLYGYKKGEEYSKVTYIRL